MYPIHMQPSDLLCERMKALRQANELLNRRSPTPRIWTCA